MFPAPKRTTTEALLPAFVASLLLAFCTLTPLPSEAQEADPEISDPTGKKEFVTQEDYTLANQAHLKREEWCENVPDLDVADREDGRAVLLSAVGGENFVLNALTTSNSKDEMSTSIQEHMNPAFIILSAGAVVLAFVVTLCWCVWCWSACCKCCRCFQRSRKIPPLVKLGFGAVWLATFIMILYAVIVTHKGHGNFSAGFHVMACEAATMLNTTLSGRQEPFFIGMIDVLQLFDSLSTDLRSNESGLVEDLQSVIRKTNQIEASSVVFSGVLQLFALMLDDPTNMNPMSLASTDLRHECMICTELAQPVKDVESTFTQGMSGALQAARQTVAEQISFKQRQALADMVDTAPEALMGFKDSIHLLAPMVDNDVVPSVRHHIDTTLFGFLIAMSIFAFFFLIASGVSWGMWTFAPSKKEMDDLIDEEITKHKQLPAKLSKWSWCCSICCIFPALFLGGMIVAFSVPFSAMCLTFDSLTGDLFDKVQNATGIALDGDSGEMFKGFIDQCLVSTDDSINPNMLEIIFQRNETGGKVTMRETFNDTVLGPIAEAFSRVGSLGSADSEPLAENEGVLKLVAILQNNPFDAFYFFDDLILSPALSDPNSGLATVTTSINCNSHTPDGVPSPPGVSEIFGISALVAKAKSVWGAPPFSASFSPLSATCAEVVDDCNDVPAGSERDACNKYNEMMGFKEALLTEAIFNCTIFEDATGADCDIKDMVFEIAEYTNDCLINVGTSQDPKFELKLKPKLCTLQEFVQYNRDMATRIVAAVDRLDKTTVEVFGEITEGLKDEVERYFISPLTRLIDGMTCGFMKRFWQGAVMNGFCFSAVPGMRELAQALVILGIAVLIIGMATFVMWRLQQDNLAKEGETQATAKVLSASE